MVLEIVKYGNPVLRQKGARIEAVTPAIGKFIDDMIETMNENQGVGLAAQQVGRALQITVIDVREVKSRPSWMEIDSRPVDLVEHMPLVLINPEVKPTGDPIMGGEGCLSFPEIFAEILRPESVEVHALNEHGKPILFKCGGLLARAVQHETDHLNGILYIDRMDKKTKEELRPELEDLQAITKTELQEKKK